MAINAPGNQWRVYSIEPATKNHPRTKGVVATFATQSEAEEWRRREDPRSQVSVGVERVPDEPEVYVESGLGAGQIKLGEPLGRLAEESRREAKRGEQVRLARQAVEKEAAGQQVSEAERFALAREKAAGTTFKVSEQPTTAEQIQTSLFERQRAIALQERVSATVSKLKFETPEEAKAAGYEVTILPRGKETKAEMISRIGATPAAFQPLEGPSSKLIPAPRDFTPSEPKGVKQQYLSLTGKYESRRQDFLIQSIKQAKEREKFFSEKLTPSEPKGVKQSIAKAAVVSSKVEQQLMMAEKQIKPSDLLITAIPLGGGFKLLSSLSKGGKFFRYGTTALAATYFGTKAFQFVAKEEPYEKIAVVEETLIEVGGFSIGAGFVGGIRKLQVKYKPVEYKLGTATEMAVTELPTGVKIASIEPIDFVSKIGKTKIEGFGKGVAEITTKEGISTVEGYFRYVAKPKNLPEARAEIRTRGTFKETEAGFTGITLIKTVATVGEKQVSTRAISVSKGVEIVGGDFPVTAVKTGIFAPVGLKPVEGRISLIRKIGEKTEDTIIRKEKTIKQFKKVELKKEPITTSYYQSLEKGTSAEVLRSIGKKQQKALLKDLGLAKGTNLGRLIESKKAQFQLEMEVKPTKSEIKGRGRAELDIMLKFGKGIEEFTRAYEASKIPKTEFALLPKFREKVKEKIIQGTMGGLEEKQERRFELDIRRQPSLKLREKLIGEQRIKTKVDVASSFKITQELRTIPLLELETKRDLKVELETKRDLKVDFTPDVTIKIPPPPPFSLGIDFNRRRNERSFFKTEPIETIFNPKKVGSLFAGAEGIRESKKFPYPKIISGLQIRPIPIRRG